MIELTKDNLEAEVLNSDLPVVIEFYSDECPVCPQLLSLIEKVSPSYEGKTKFAKCNMYQNPSIAAKFQVAHASKIAVVYKDRILGTFPGALIATSGEKKAIRDEYLKQRIDDYLKRI